MLLQLTHRTRYDYAPPVKTAQHMAHLKPLATASQRVLSHRLEIEPAPAQRTETVDVYGNTRTFFGLRSAHDSLTVTAQSIVETAPPPAPASTIAWDAARERLRYHRQAAYDPAAEFAFASPQVPRHRDFAAYAGPSFADGRPLLDAAADLMARVHADFEYHTAATDAGTPALEALALLQGVCQDFAHVMLGCLRSLGLAARYVSGYLLTEPPPGETRLVGSDASHAWVELYLPAEGRAGGAWAGFDPTNTRAPGEDYVTLAIGRDYSDVSPLRGVIHGGARHELQVAVTVTPVMARQARRDHAPTIADPKEAP
jgi:transglutaminase-like putative cysteine protease